MAGYISDLWNSKLSIRNAVMDVQARLLEAIRGKNPQKMREALDSIYGKWRCSRTQAEEVIDRLRQSDPDLILAAAQTKDVEVFKAVADGLAFDLNRHYVWRSSDPNRPSETVATYLLYKAIEADASDIALYMAEQPNTDIDKGVIRTRSGETTTCSPLELAREKGMIKLVIFLAERSAALRRQEGVDYKARKDAAADRLEYEATQLRQLNLPDGSIRLPDTYARPETPAPPQEKLVIMPATSGPT